MNLTIFGAGYVGLVTGVCLAELGNDVVCIDTDADKVAALQQGKVPIYEPGLEALVRSNARAGRLVFSSDMAYGVAHGDVQFIAVGTPSADDGSADLRYVFDVARAIATHMTGFKVIDRPPEQVLEKVRMSQRRPVVPAPLDEGASVKSACGQPGFDPDLLDLAAC